MQQEEKPKTAAITVDFGQLAEDDPRRVTAQRRLAYVRGMLAAAPRRWDAVTLLRWPQTWGTPVGNLARAASPKHWCSQDL